MTQPGLWNHRKIVWFSCGAASACAAKIAVTDDPEVQVMYCDTSVNESEDNNRFLADVERWIGCNIQRLRSNEFPSMNIYDVFRKRKYIVGRLGAPCTQALKKEVRWDIEEVGDTHIFGYTADEEKRIKRFVANNPELLLEFPLRDRGITKAACYEIVKAAGIELPLLYRQGYNNNNCIGCVKGGIGYWNKIRVDYPDAFQKMAALERELGAKICKLTIDGKRELIYLDELPPNVGDHKSEPEMECGPMCQVEPE